MTATFESARQGLRELQASVTEERLVELLSRHAETEDEILSRYGVLAERSGSPAVRYLVDLIVDDERRHHRILAELANAVAWGWTGWSPEPAVPELPAGRPDAELARLTRELLRSERADRHELRQLRHEFSEFADTTLWPLLVDLMELDTRKHVTILQFVAEHPEVPGATSHASEELAP